MNLQRQKNMQKEYKIMLINSLQEKEQRKNELDQKKEKEQKKRQRQNHALQAKMQKTMKLTQTALAPIPYDKLMRQSVKYMKEAKTDATTTEF